MAYDINPTAEPIERSLLWRHRGKCLGVAILVFAVLVAGIWQWRKARASLSFQGASVPAEEEISEPLAPVYAPDPIEEQAQDNAERWPILPPPPDPSMDLIKSRGCVADGLLNGYGGDERSSVALINRSECYYLHRALETWLEPPDFETAYEIHESITKPNTVYGMFLAEAIDTKADYEYPAEDRDFDFKKMCRKGSQNFWGEHTCKPSLESAEYRKYLDYITERAMDLGVQVFLFGQVFYQDSSDMSQSRMPEVIASMRAYAEYRGMKIFIGAQTNDIKDEQYLRQFDFIEGGVGIDSEGNIENGPCFSRWWKEPGDWCWALLWHEEYASKAKNVLVHLDWSGKVGDDMSRFVRMSSTERENTLTRLHQYFTNKKIGFLMPMMARLHRDNGGCYGGDKHFYSSSRKYSCKDEESINRLLREKRP